MAQMTAQMTDTPAQPAAVRGGVVHGVSQQALPLIATLYLFSMIIPMVISVGPIALSMYRLILLLAFVPLFVNWLSRRYDRIYAGDVLLLAYCAWFFVAMFYHHGTQHLQGAGQSMVDAFGGFLLARATIRNPTQLKQMSRYLTIAVIVTIPVAVVEAVTGRLLLNELFRMIPGVSVYYPIYGPRRLGVDRVQGPFEHQILYGLFCASALTFAVLLRRRPGSALLTCFASALSMSTGALMAMVLQIGLLSWNWVTKAIKKRWRLLIILIILAYIAVDFLSNRSPIQVFISYATFNAGSGYWRLAIWEYGSQNVIDNPVMGIGMNTWERPNWLHSGSVDNFWLVIAMRTGFPGVLLMMAGFALVLREVARAKPVDPEVQNCQRAWMITVISLFVAAGTVHVWNGMYSFLFFLVGSGLWIVDYARREALQDPEAAAAPEAPVLRGHARWVHGRPGEDDAGAGEAPAAVEPAAPTMHGDPVEALRAARRRRDRTPR